MKSIWQFLPCILLAWDGVTAILTLPARRKQISGSPGEGLGEGSWQRALPLWASHRESCVLQAESSDADPQLVQVVTAPWKEADESVTFPKQWALFKTPAKSSGYKQQTWPSLKRAN